MYLSSWSSKPDLVTVKLMIVTLIHTLRTTETHIRWGTFSTCPALLIQTSKILHVPRTPDCHVTLIFNLTFSQQRQFVLPKLLPSCIIANTGIKTCIHPVLSGWSVRETDQSQCHYRKPDTICTNNFATMAKEQTLF